MLKMEIFDDANAVAQQAVNFIVAEARSAIDQRGRFIIAVSGGQTPWLMLRYLADESLPWSRIQVVQVDERVALFGDPDRNLTHLRDSLLARVPVPAVQIHAMPVEEADLHAACQRYTSLLAAIAGKPPVLDLVHLGLGPDGHTASLVPGDSVLEETHNDVGLTEAYQNRRRMTLTYPIINRSRRILWLVTGNSKVEMLAQLLSADSTIPAGRVLQDHALVYADRAAAGT